MDNKIKDMPTKPGPTKPPINKEQEALDRVKKSPLHKLLEKSCL